MAMPASLQGDRWTERTARKILPLVIWCAKNGVTITYGQLDNAVVSRNWGHHVMAVQYGYPAGAIGSALIELEKLWERPIPPLNAIIVNAQTGMPGKGVSYFLERYCSAEKKLYEMSASEKKAIIDEVHSDIFSFQEWDRVLEECELQYETDGILLNDVDADNISSPTRGGWSSEPESQEHKALKKFIAKNPEKVGIYNSIGKAVQEYLFASGDRVDVLFTTENNKIAVEVKSIISNDNDLNRGLFQCVKYQAVLRAEQKATNNPPIGRAILVTERELTPPLEILTPFFGIVLSDYGL